MGRLSTIDEAALYAVVGEVLSRQGSIRLQDVVDASGVSIGSIYHRFGSREALLAHAFQDAVKVFQEAFFEALESGAPDAGEQAAQITPRFCRRDRARARLLFCCRREELLSGEIPAALQSEIEANQGLAARRVRAFARRNGLSEIACRLGLVAYPLGAVRLYLPDRPIPRSLDAHVAAAYRTAVTLEA